MLILPGMMVALAAYIALHSPLRSELARLLGRPGHAAYFTQPGPTPAAVNAAAAAFLIIAALLAASAVTRRAGVQSYERPLIFAVSAFAFMVVAAAYLGVLAAWTGTGLLRPPAGPLMASTPALVVLGIALYRGWRPSLRLRHLPVDGLLIPLGALAATLFVISIAVNLSQPPTGFDALAFHAPMAVYFWRDGDLVSLLDRAPGGFALAHGGASELWVGLLLLLGGERLANLGQLPFAVVGAFAAYAFSRRLGLGGRAACLGAAGFLLMPMVVAQAGIQVTDLVSAALLMSAAALACAPSRQWTTVRVAVTAVALGLAVTTKLAAVPPAAAIALFVGASYAFTQRAWRPMVVAAVVFTIAFTATVGPWWARNAVRYGNPIFPAAIPFVGRGLVVGDFAQKDDRFVPSRSAWPLYPLLEPHSDASGLGGLFLIGALPGIAAACRRRRRALVLFGTIAAFTLPSWWTLTQHEPRHLLALFGLSFAFVPWSLIAVPRRLRPAATLTLVVAAAFSALVTIDQTFVPRLGNPSDRARFYDEVWGIDTAVASRPETEPLLYHTGFASLSYAGDYALLGPSLGRRLITLDGTVSTSDIVALMQNTDVALAYVPASPASRGVIEATYDSRFFTLEHLSTVLSGERSGTRRYLYRLHPRIAGMARVNGTVK